MPIYKITTKGSEAKRLVKAESAAQAIRHCAKDVFTAETVTGVEDAADLIESGVKIEKVSAADAAAAAEVKTGEQQDGKAGQQKPPPAKDD